VRSLGVIGAAHPLAVRRAVVRDLRGQGRATAGYALAYQVPRWPERALRIDDGARVERIMRSWAGAEWAASDDFALAVLRNRQAIQVPGAVHCAMEYHRWAVRSQFRGDGRRFAAAVARPVVSPVLQIHGAQDPCLLERTAAGSGRWAGRGLRHEVLDGVGHFPHQERPDVVTELIDRFLAG
ncbi:MAG: alpha/beta hydrolase, partial [Pseudonocardia sp.]|nr:alpha/beta hydrolase [Pseudonocardia sp.]